MINIVSLENQEKYFNSFEDETLKGILKERMKILFIENGELYFVLNPAEDEVSILRDNWSKLVTKSISVLKDENVKGLKRILETDEKVLFLEKSIEICKAKEVKFSVALR